MKISPDMYSLLIERNSLEERVWVAYRSNIKRPEVPSETTLGFHIGADTLGLDDLSTSKVSSVDWMVSIREIFQYLGILFFAG